MGKNIKSVPVIIVISALSIGLWVATTFDNLKDISVRSSNDTTTRYADSTERIPNRKPEVVSPQTNPANSPAIETPIEQIPEPQDRMPRSTLSERALKDLGIEAPIEEEQVFYTTATTPDDPIYPQWYTTIVDAPNAWDTSTGSADTLVAVIDTGYALDHEDLSSAWFINNGEQGTTQSGEVCWTGSPEDKQTNSCDDDENGYIDDWRGWDFAGGDNNAQTATNSVTGSSHGTKSAGLVGGRGNNLTGVASINWQTEILPLQALYDEGYGYSTDITAAIHYAVEMGADVINLSLGGPSPDSFTRAAVQYAQRNNVVVVASSGNCGDTQSTPDCTGYPSPGGMSYPARYPETIAVGATTSSDTQASFSSWGDEITLVAPGSGSIQTPTWVSGNEVSAYSATSYGTSFSSPIVAGVVAHAKAQMPEVTNDEVIALLANSSDKVTGMGGQDWTQQYGWGRLNVNRLLNEISDYKTQLQKGAGQISEQTTNLKPQVSSNTGHTSSTGITSSTTVRTYCLTTPNTVCDIKLRYPSGGTIILASQLTNAQGVTVFEWTKGSRTNGDYIITAIANSLSSSNESLKIK